MNRYSHIRAKQAAKPKHSPLPEHTPPAPYCARCGSTARSDTALTDTVVLSGREYAEMRGKPAPPDDAELAAIRERCEKASDGPWTIQRGGGKARVIDSNGHGVAQFANFNSRSNRIFVAHARTDIPALLSRIDAERARAEAADRRAGMAGLATAQARADRLETENDRLKEALDIADEIVEMAERGNELDWSEDRTVTWRNMRCADYHTARAALEQKEPSR